MHKAGGERGVAGATTYRAWRHAARGAAWARERHVRSADRAPDRPPSRAKACQQFLA